MSASLVKAGRYARLMPIGATTGAVLGAGGSLLGNLTDKEEGEGPLRLLSEATTAGVLSGLTGGLAGAALGSRNLAKARAVDAIKRRALNAPELKNVAREAAPFLMKTAIGSTVATPIIAGLGGMYGGGSSNLYDAIGIPGFNKGIDPEAYGSSNLQQTRPNSLYQMRTDLNR